MKPLMIGAAAATIAWSAAAAELAGTKLEDAVTVAGRELVLNGAGVRTRAIFKVYVASLYLPAKASEATAALAAVPRRVQLNLLRSVSADQLIDALHDGLRDNNGASELIAMKPQVDQLDSIMRALKEAKEKDVITLDFVDGGTQVSLNGAARGTIAGEAFNRALLKVWLGERPAQADLKKALLGG